MVVVGHLSHLLAAMSEEHCFFTVCFMISLIICDGQNMCIVILSPIIAEIHITLLRTHLETCSLKYDMMLLTHLVSYYMPIVQEEEICVTGFGFVTACFNFSPTQ